MIEKEIVIVGAGPAGLTAALFLAKNNIKSTVLEKGTFPKDKICGDAFSGKVAWVLNKLDSNLFNSLTKETYTIPSWGVKFYGTQNNELKVPFKTNYNTSTDTAPGFISKRLDFDDKLYHLAKSNPLIEIIENCSVTNTYRKDKTIVIETKNQQNFETKLLLAADGAYSNIAKKLMNIKINDNKNSLGLRTYYKGVSNLDKEGFIELHFLKEITPGYFWIFPLPNGQANVGIGIRSDIIKKKKINLKAVFNSIIEQHPIISGRFKNAELIDKPKLHGLPLGGLTNISTDNLILLGDAAALIDPFTGEGIGHAMISGYLASEVIKKNYSTKNYSKEAL
ncbi:MAG: NAD(P)/FAD-dependent oxidoreductase, partial [Chitinophagales bacterium]